MMKLPSSTTVSAMSRSRSAAVLAFTEAERAQVLNHLEAIFQSPVFRNSKRYCALLRFVVERALDGQGDQLKERTIGVEAFGRPADYDTNIDHSVRSAAGEVRRRLAQYYLEYGDLSGMRIELTPGSYVPQIRFVEAAQPDSHPDLLLFPLPVEPTHATVERRWLNRNWKMAAVALVAVATLSFGAVRVRMAMSPVTPYQALWSPIVTSPSTALICQGGGSGPAPAEAPKTLFDFEHLPIRRVNASDALALAAVTGALSSQGKAYRVLNRAHVATFNDLRQGPFILIGAMNNEWSLRLTSKLRFTFAHKEGGGGYIADSQNPTKTDWSFNYGAAFDQPTRDYAVVTRLREPMTEQAGLVVAGIGAWGTQAAGEFVSTPDHVRKLEALAPRDWQQKNFQVVLQTEVIRGSSGPPVVLAAYFW